MAVAAEGALFLKKGQELVTGEVPWNNGKLRRQWCQGREEKRGCGDSNSAQGCY